ncbi:hypothetical protein J6590_068490 [Homalodisca vitripennis]|nr:hypothetical protein J6590_068490 [Homalodisca vitripennis]
MRSAFLPHSNIILTNAVRGHCLLVRPVHQLIEMSTVIRSRAGSRREGDQCWSIDDSVPPTKPPTNTKPTNKTQKPNTTTTHKKKKKLTTAYGRPLEKQ